MASDRINSALRWKAIVPSDTDTLEPVPATIRVNGGGTIWLVGEDGNAEDFEVADGDYLPCQAVKVLATGTTATGIKGLSN